MIIACLPANPNYVGENIYLFMTDNIIMCRQIFSIEDSSIII